MAQNISPENWVWWFLVTLVHKAHCVFVFFKTKETTNYRKKKKWNMIPYNGNSVAKAKLCEILFSDSISMWCIFSSAWSENSTTYTVSFVAKIHAQNDRVIIWLNAHGHFRFYKGHSSNSHIKHKRLTSWTFHIVYNWITINGFTVPIHCAFKMHLGFRSTWFHSHNGSLHKANTCVQENEQG